MWSSKIKDAAQKFKDTWTRSDVAVIPLKPMDNTTGFARVADDAAVSLGRKLRSLARDFGSHSAPIGLSSATSFSASHGLEKAGKYLENEGFSGAINDFGQHVKKNPLPFIALGVGVGLLLGRILPSRR